VTVVICRPDTFPLRRIMHCPTCGRRRRFAGLDAAWYGPTMTCCGCGDSWTDGEPCPRPFRRGWRKDAIAKAKQTWADAAGKTRADHRRWLHAELHGQSGGDATRT
jgi:hypothetical protein